MKTPYDKYYQTENLFGNPFPKLLSFFTNYPQKEKLLDLGCGQGRDAIPLARMGYEVTGIDCSKVGIEQMNKVAEAENLKLTGIVSDIYAFEDYADFEFILLDSMFHFLKKDKEKETALVKRIIDSSQLGTVIAFCIQDTPKKVGILNTTIDHQRKLERIYEEHFLYEFVDRESGHSSRTNYKMIVVQK